MRKIRKTQRMMLRKMFGKRKVDEESWVAVPPQKTPISELVAMRAGLSPLRVRGCGYWNWRFLPPTWQENSSRTPQLEFPPFI